MLFLQSLQTRLILSAIIHTGNANIVLLCSFPEFGAKWPGQQFLDRTFGSQQATAEWNVLE